MHKFVRNLLTEWRKLGLPFNDATFVVAISGGADSVSLALALDDLRKRKKLNLRFVIAHFNHDLRGEESEKDTEFVKKLTQEFNFELEYKKGKVSKKGNLEQNARLARYAFLLETAQNLNADGILIAHTINDQAETFLLNLIRGSGISGLSAMKPVLENYELRITNYELKSQVSLIRPLLSWATREATEDFCHFNKIIYREDSMNEDLSFKRVRVRKVLLPMLKEFNPKIIETLSRTANLIQIETENTFDSSSFETNNISLKELQHLPTKRLYGTLRNWIEFNRGDLKQIELKHIEAVERLIFKSKSGKIIELPNGSRIIKEKGELSFFVDKTK